MSEIHKVSICLSDIPKERMTKASNGKFYVTIVSVEKKETDKYGKNCTAYLEQTKEEREFSRDKIYVGSGWVTKFEEKKQENAQEVNSSLDSGDSDTSDLPF